MSINDGRKHRTTLLALLVAGGLFSAAASTAFSNMTAFAQPNNSPFEGNITGSIFSDKGNVTGNSSLTLGNNSSVHGNPSASEKGNASSYKPSYPKERADEKRQFVVHAEKHLYKPGEEVKLEGSIWTSLIDQIGGNISSVKLNVTDNKGNVTLDQKEAVVNDDGTFAASFTLPENAEQGSYFIDAMIELDADTLALQADLESNLETSARFEVISPNAFAVKSEDGRSFNIDIASNSTVKEVEFKQQEKKISLHVEGQTGTRGITEITIPKALLSGQITVSIDGKVIPPESSEVVTIADTDEGMTLEVNYHHSEHTIEIAGTSVVPEFPLAMMVMAAAIGSVIVAATMMARKRSSLF